MNDIHIALHKAPSEHYGVNYQSHLLEQYKLCVEMADRVSQRRQSANNFFLSVHTGLLALLGIIIERGQPPFSLGLVLLISVPALVLVFCWYRLIRSYRDLNTGKFKVIHAMEEQLPTAPFEAEWKAVGEGKDRKLYLPFTHIECLTPWIFAVIHFLFAAWVIYLLLTDC
jgi:hypothetical protein